MAEFDESRWYTDVERVRAGRFETGLDDPELKQHIDAANQRVERELDDDISDERTLATIETNLARHRVKFLVESEQFTTSEKTGPISRDFAGAFDGEALLATPYGQTAIDDDPTGTLDPEVDGDFWVVTG